MSKPFLALLLGLCALPATAQPACPPAGGWVDAAGAPVQPAAADALLAGGRVALLGERHATPAHHLWQRDRIAALAALGPVVIGLEQLPRASQPALDRWVAGELSEAEFLAESRWKERWGHDFAAYRPVFELARARRLPMLALNIERDFVRRVGREGYAAAAADSKAPVGRPAAPPAAYVAMLEESFRQHGRTPTPEAVARFAEAQATWDRAMAEAIVGALRVNPAARVAAIMGWGHVAHGHGVEWQLKDLGVGDVGSAIPVAPEACEPKPGAADLLFGAG